jgi:hypothetical protein
MEMLSIVQDEKIQGMFYPNSKTQFFKLYLSDDELIILKLKTPFRHGLIIPD